MIVGIGIDVVDIARFARTLEATPRMLEKLFHERERDMPIESLAARFAAKEAIAKALGSPGGMLFHDAVIERRTGHPPQVEVHGTVAAVASEKGVRNFHLSLSHDGGVATAMVIAEG